MQSSGESIKNRMLAYADAADEAERDAVEAARTYVQGCNDKGEPVRIRPVQLDIWQGTKLALPVILARCALFAASKRGKRVAVDRKQLASWKNTSIEYTGFGLTQNDLDILLAITRTAEDGICRTSANGLLRAAGKAIGGAGATRLKGQLTYMTACAIKIQTREKSYTGNLLNWAYDENTGELIIAINGNLRGLYDSVSYLESECRKSLRSDLSKWLHGYISSHTATIEHPHRIKVKTLHELSGSSYSDMHAFIFALKKSLQEIGQFLMAWDISHTGVLTVAKCQAD